MRYQRKKKNYAGIWISIFLALIMVTSIIGFIFGDNPSGVVRYKNLKFTQLNQGWKVKYEGRDYIFSFEPNSLEQINISDSIKFDNLLELDVTYDVNSTYKEAMAQSIFELSNILSQRGVFVRAGFTSNSSYNLPIITCEDATQGVPVIYYSASNKTSISMSGNCIMLESEDSYSFLLLTNRLAYRILGIM